MVIGAQPGTPGLCAEHIRPAIERARTQPLLHATGAHDIWRLRGDAHGPKPMREPGLDQHAADRRVQVHVLVRVGVIERQARGGEGAVLRRDLGRDLPPAARTEEVFQCEAELVGGEPPRAVHQMRHGAGQHGIALDHHEVQAYPQIGHLPGATHRIAGRGAGHHQAGGAEDAVPMRPLHRLVHRLRQAEIVGGDDDALGAHAALLRSRRKVKNSTPSRRRRFIICGLRTISPTMEAILGPRK